MADPILNGQALGDEDKTLRIPNDVPSELFDIVSQILNFVEKVDEIKGKMD